MPRFHFAALAAALCATSTWAGTSGFYRQPAIQGDTVYLVAEGDLWRVGAQGGDAQRLTTHPGLESQPAVSPDGRWLAFTGQYDGGTEIYLMPATGGPPQRLTWEGGGMRVWGFSAAGEVIYTALDARPGHQLFAIDVKTGQRRQLPVGQASDGALSADGRTLYFTRQGMTRNDNARQYRGGSIARLWALDLAGTAEARPLLAEGNNDRRPMPYRVSGAERVAFLSDRDGTVNVWSVDAQGGDLRQHTTHKGWDIRHASVDGSRVVYALGADLYTLDLAQADAPRKLAVSLGGDFDQQRERWIKKPQDYLTDTAFAPNGERALLAARGHLATQGVQALRRAQLPQPADGRCRSGEFSSDSRSVFAVCDFSGETEIWRFAANGSGQPERITNGADTQRRDLLPSPDGRWLAHTDKEGRIWLTDLKTKATREIGRGLLGDPPQLQAWSPDGQALAWTLHLRHLDRSQLQVHGLADGRTHTLTSDRYDSDAATFSPDGQWLYFASSRHFETTGDGAPWGDRNTGPFFGFRSKLYALALQPGLRSPFAAKDELESPAEKKADEQRAEDRKATDKEPTERKADDKDKKPAAEKKGKPGIVFDGLAERLHELPVPAGNHRALRTDGKRLWFLDRDLDGKSQLKSVAVDNQGGPAEILAHDVRSYALSADGKKLMLVRNQGGGAAPEVLIVDAAPKLPADLSKLTVRWTDWQIATQPRAEWRQMFIDAWRMHRDHFYDVAMHGVDWTAVRARYEPLVDRVTDRFELAELMAQMAAELGALHSQVGVGDTRPAPDVPGLAGLGGRFSRVPGGWRIDAIYGYELELPSEAPPLAAAGVGLKVGDVITHVNGRATAQAPHILELLRGEAGRQVLLDVKTVDGQAVQRIVTPVAQARETQLRYNDWRVSRARAVEQAGLGRIGYVHLRAMGAADIADFVREFYAASDREGLIIDVRYNGGGNIDSWILEKLLRRGWAFWQPRSPAGSAGSSNMQNVWRGHTVVLMNEDTYSDGETFAEGFKRLKLGPVIGRQSAGAGVWLSDDNRLVDNGIMRAAEYGQIDAEGRFLIEGMGVKPDMDVDNPPRASFLGQDAQLDAAIAELKQRIAAEPIKTVKPGPYLRPVKP